MDLNTFSLIKAVKWKNKYKIKWCYQCDTAAIVCPDCENSSCNAGGCGTCIEDFIKFNKNTKSRVQSYLTGGDRIGYEKGLEIQRFILGSLEDGQNEINWHDLKTNGMLSSNNEELFSKELTDK